MSKNSEGGIKPIGENRKARHLYFFEDTVEAGMSLVGTEVKSIRAGQYNFSDSYIRITEDEAYLHGFHISPYSHGNLNNHEQTRTRKLLLHKGEIRKLRRKVDEKGFTLVPAKIYYKNGKIKIAVALAKGKKDHDKRHSLKDKAQKRDMEREIKYR